MSAYRGISEPCVELANGTCCRFDGYFLTVLLMRPASLSTTQVFGLGITVFLINLIWKGLYLGSQPIAGDEPFSIYVANNLCVSDIIGFLTSGNNPPLWELILHYWTSVFGIGEVSVRFLPLIFSSTTALLLFSIGTRYFDWQTGLLSAAFVTFTDYHIHFAHEARSYALFGMLTCLSMMLFMRVLLDKSKNRFILMGLSLSNTAIIYTHFFGIWILFIQALTGVSMILRDKSFRSSSVWLWSFMVPAILFMPYAPILWERFNVSAESGTWLSAPNGLFSILDMLRTFLNEQYGTSNFYGSKPFLTLLTVACSVWGHFNYMRCSNQKNPSAYHTIVVWFITPFLTLWVVSFWIPMFHDRYLIFVSVAFAIVLSIGIRHLFRNDNVSNVVAIGFALILFATGNPDVSNKRDLRTVVGKVRELRKENPELPVVICPEWFGLGFLYHFDRACFSQPATVETFYSNADKCLQKESVYAVRGVDQLALSDADIEGGVILIDADARFSYPENGLSEHFSNHLQSVETFKIPEIFDVTLYTARQGN